MKVVICLYKGLLKFVYFFLKFLPVNNQKIVFISRQSDNINIDFKLLSEELVKRNKNLKIVFLCHRMKKTLFDDIYYFFHIFKQMFHLATSKVVILDSYCIPVSVLKHKKSLFVLQLWHSIGKIKKSGYQTLDSPSGRNKKLAYLMCMHKNYDKIIVGGKAFTPYYEECFNVSRDKFLYFGLPRIDYLIDNQKSLKNKIYKQYPEFKKKKIIFYVPTFRTYEVAGYKNLINNYNKEKFILIIKSHPNQKLEIPDNIYTCPDFKTSELLTIADYVITDYSSLCLESAVLNKKVLFYVYDYEKYMSENGMNLDVYKKFPTLASKNINDLLKIIENNDYDNKTYQKFRQNYLPTKLGTSTKLIADYIMKKVV